MKITVSWDVMLCSLVDIYCVLEDCTASTFRQKSDLHSQHYGNLKSHSYPLWGGYSMCFLQIWKSLNIESYPPILKIEAVQSSEVSVHPRRQLSSKSLPCKFQISYSMYVHLHGWTFILVLCCWNRVEFQFSILYRVVNIICRTPPQSNNIPCPYREALLFFPSVYNVMYVQTIHYCFQLQ
jgi:hypothetical protein